MKTYQEFLTELFDKPLPYKEYHGDEEASYDFVTPKGQGITVEIVPDQFGSYEFSFENNQSMPEKEAMKTNTGQGEEIKIFSTVLDILYKFIRIELPDHFYTQAVLSEPSRVKLYRRLFSQFTKKYPDYKVTETTKAPAKRGFIRFDAKVQRKHENV